MIDDEECGGIGGIMGRGNGRTQRKPAVFSILFTTNAT
jgi:hypothetical protein